MPAKLSSLSQPAPTEGTEATPTRSGALYRCNSETAFANAKRNDLRRYPSPETDGARLYPLVSPAARPGFTLSRDDTVFAIGSCFARNLEGALNKAGMNVLSRELDLGPIGESVGAARNFLNKYTAPSVLNDLRWALERDSFPGEAIIYPVSDGVYCDPQLGMVRLAHPLDAILQMRQRYLDAMAQAAEADVVILTLGYVEAWYDKELDLYLNIAPPPRICKANPERFEFRVLGFDDVLQALEEIYAVLKKHRKTPLKMLLTVSPVPLISTFRDVDVLVANTYSKAVQRAAAETFIADKPDVDYFPSYEFVTLSNPKVCWARGDYRHISPDIVARIMSNVLVSYMPDIEAPGRYRGTQMTAEAIFGTARMLIKLGEGAELAALVKENLGLFDAEQKLLLSIVDALQVAEQWDTQIAALERLVDRAPERPRLLQRLISATTHDPAHAEKTRALLTKHAARFPSHAGFREKIEASLA